MFSFMNTGYRPRPGPRKELRGKENTGYRPRPGPRKELMRKILEHPWKHGARTRKHPLDQKHTT